MRPEASGGATPASGRPAAAAAELPLRHALRLVEEHAKVGYWYQDLTTGKITVSPGLAAISGMPDTGPDAREGMVRAFNPDDSSLDAARRDRGAPARGEFRIERPDGTTRWVSTRVEAVPGGDGLPRSCFGVVLDISAWRCAQRVHALDAERATAVLDAVSAFTWSSDASGRVHDDAGWFDLTGRALADRDREGWLEAVHPDDRERIRTAVGSANESGTVCNLDFRILAIDGRFLWYNARIAPVRDASGTIRERLGVLLPIAGDHRPAIRSAEGLPPAELPPLSGAEIRGARGLLDWSLSQLAAASRVSVSTIKRMEDGSEANTRPSKSEAVRRALEHGGVRFRVVDGETWIARAAAPA